MDNWLLTERQKLPLDIKVKITLDRIKEWYKHYNGRVCISFSGGKDSTVLLDLARKVFPEILAVFVDTGLEFLEIRNFVKTVKNVYWLKPRKKFKDIIYEYGYPVISKDQACAIDRYRTTKDPVQRYYRLNGFPNGKKGMISKKWQYLLNTDIKISDKCCYYLKQSPLNSFHKRNKLFPMSAMMAYESNFRKRQYLKQGCNSFSNINPISWPMGFWTDKDIWEYINKYRIEYSSIYKLGYNRTGCMFCMFGCHLERFYNNRFLKMKNTHPKQWDYCINKLGCGEVLDAINVYYGKRYPL